MHLVPIDQIEDLKKYVSSWSSLLDRVSESSTVYLTPEWIFNWWDSYGSGMTLQVLLLLEGKRLVGVAPFSINKRNTLGLPFRYLRFIGSGHADHLDLCLEPQWRRAGIIEILEYLNEKCRWDVLDLVDVPDDSPNLSLLLDMLGDQKVAYSAGPTIPCPYLKLDSVPWSAFYAQKRSKSSRKDLERRLRRLGELGEASFNLYRNPDAVRRVFPQLLSVYQKRWENKNLSLSFTGPKEQKFYLNVAMGLARSGRLHLLTLELDGVVIAFTLSAIHRDRFTWLITAFDPEYNRYFAGELILTRLLEEVFGSERYLEFDFTRGGEPYKYKWTEEERWNLRILARNGSPLSIIPYLLFRLYISSRREAKKYEFLKRIKLDLLGRVRSVVRH